jgi:hypothetical protein
MRRLAVAAVLALLAPHAAAERITDARYALPVDRYGHYALGPPHEYARLTATTDTGRRVSFDLPVNEVFEDLAPRLVRLTPHEPEELLVIVSSRDAGARLVIFRLNGGRLEAAAQSPPIGTPMRWLNPVGVADLDGDGRAEIAAVITPHIGGTLKVYRRQGVALVEVAALGGFSNHVYRSTELALSMPFALAGRPVLLVPNASRRDLRIVAFEHGRLVEIARCELSGPVVGPIRAVSGAEVSLGLQSGPVRIAPGECPGPGRDRP